MTFVWEQVKVKDGLIIFIQVHNGAVDAGAVMINPLVILIQ